MSGVKTFEPIITKFCMLGEVVDVITDAKFYGNQLRDFGVTGPPKTPFPILNTHRNSVLHTITFLNLTLNYYILEISAN